MKRIQIVVTIVAAFCTIAACRARGGGKVEIPSNTKGSQYLKERTPVAGGSIGSNLIDAKIASDGTKYFLWQDGADGLYKLEQSGGWSRNLEDQPRGLALDESAQRAYVVQAKTEVTQTSIGWGFKVTAFRMLDGTPDGGDDIDARFAGTEGCVSFVSFDPSTVYDAQQIAVSESGTVVVAAAIKSLGGLIADEIAVFKWSPDGVSLAEGGIYSGTEGLNHVVRGLTFQGETLYVYGEASEPTASISAGPQSPVTGQPTFPSSDPAQSTWINVPISSWSLPVQSAPTEGFILSLSQDGNEQSLFNPVSTVDAFGIGAGSMNYRKAGNGFLYLAGAPTNASDPSGTVGAVLVDGAEVVFAVTRPAGDEDAPYLALLRFSIPQQDFVDGNMIVSAEWNAITATGMVKDTNGLFVVSADLNVNATIEGRIIPSEQAGIVGVAEDLSLATSFLEQGEAYFSSTSKKLVVRRKAPGIFWAFYERTEIVDPEQGIVITTLNTAEIDSTTP